MPTQASIAQFEPRGNGNAGGILHLPLAMERFQTDKIVLGCRASGLRTVENGSLKRQEERCLTAIRNAGGTVVAIVGNDRPQRGTLSPGRPDLDRGREYAEQHGAILCYQDLTRLFRPAAYHAKKNRHAPYTAEDFAELRGVVATVPLAVTVPPHLSLTEVHSFLTTRGMEQAKAEGRRAGRPTVIREKMAVSIGAEFCQDRPLSIAQIARKYGVSRSTVKRLHAEFEDSGYPIE